MYGMSPTTKAYSTARQTAEVKTSISSIVTGSVVSYPRTVMPTKSPTRIISTPARSMRSAVG
jgi:hypothetical protein